jgi:leader peptidase (prepilin peptidase)/N-methyltransferase
VSWAHFATIAAFGFLAGASVGSFLNVCVWRLPRGESLIRPPSRCPRCGGAIRSRDNLPVLGWLLLRGRCRRCAEAISARYPLVEAATGFFFAAVLVLETLWDPANVVEGGGASFLAAARVILFWSVIAVVETTSLIAFDRRRKPSPAHTAGAPPDGV